MQYIENKDGCQYNITVLSQSVESIPTDKISDWDDLPSHAKWSWKYFSAPPPIGTRVKVAFNNLGTGVVEGYFIEHGWVGVHILPDQRPEWHIQQNGGKNYYLVFGSEIEPT